MGWQQRPAFFLWVGALCALLSGCAGMAGASAEEAVARRAQARWELLVQGKLDEAYDYLSPANRSVTSLEKYKGSIKPGLWTGAKVRGVSCRSAEVCEAKIAVSYRIRTRGAGVLQDEAPLTEVWQRDQGRWWFVSSH